MGRNTAYIQAGRRPRVDKLPSGVERKRIRNPPRQTQENLSGTITRSMPVPHGKALPFLKEIPPIYRCACGVGSSRSRVVQKYQSNFSRIGGLPSAEHILFSAERWLEAWIYAHWQEVRLTIALHAAGLLRPYSSEYMTSSRRLSTSSLL